MCFALGKRFFNGFIFFLPIIISGKGVYKGDASGVKPNKGVMGFAGRFI